MRGRQRQRSREQHDRGGGYTVPKDSGPWSNTARSRNGPNAVQFKTAGSQQSRVGWALGGGAEYAITSNWSLKVEGLYVDLGEGRRPRAFNTRRVAAYRAAPTQPQLMAMAVPGSFEPA